MSRLFFVLIGLFTIDGTYSRTLTENNVENNNADALTMNVAPSDKHNGNRRRYSNTHRQKADAESDSLESVALAINKGVQQLLADKSSADIVGGIGKFIAQFAKNTDAPNYRSKGQYDIKPEIVHFRSEKPSVMFEINSKSIIQALRDVLQSKVLHQYMDHFSEKAAVIYRSLKKNYEKQAKSAQQDHQQM